MLLEVVQQLQEVEHRAGEAVVLVDDHDVDPTRIDVRDEALQPRAVRGAAAETRVGVVVGQEHPSIRPLARDVRCGRLALRFDRPVLLVGLVLGRDADVRGTADRRSLDGHPRPRSRTVPLRQGHQRLCRFRSTRAQKRRPFQCAPVAARAASLSDP